MSISVILPFNNTEIEIPSIVEEYGPKACNIVKENVIKFIATALFVDYKGCYFVVDFPFTCCSYKFIEKLYKLSCEGKYEKVAEKMGKYYVSLKEY